MIFSVDDKDDGVNSFVLGKDGHSLGEVVVQARRIDEGDIHGTVAEHPFARTFGVVAVHFPHGK